MEYSEDTVMETRGLTFSYDGEQNILENLDFAIPAGKVTVLMGANGCGKSTLFKLMTKNLYPDEGSIILEGEGIDEMRLKDFAKKVAIVHQNNTAPPDLTVERLVGYGRTPYLGAFQTAGGQEDEEAVEWAMEITDVKNTGTKVWRNCPEASGSGFGLPWLWPR